MKQCLAVILFSLLYVFVNAQTPATDQNWGDPDWEDDFDGYGTNHDRLNPNFWSTNFSWGHTKGFFDKHFRPDEVNTLPYNNIEFLQENNTTFVRLKGKKENYQGDWNFDVWDDANQKWISKNEKHWYEYTSSQLSTQNKKYFSYGYIEARVRLPDNNVFDSHPWGRINSTIWLYDRNESLNINHSEIDIFEILTDPDLGAHPFPLDNTFTCSIHYSEPFSTVSGYPGVEETFTIQKFDPYRDPVRYPNDPTRERFDDYKYFHNRYWRNNLAFNGGWHKFGVEWLPNMIRFYIDDLFFIAVSGEHLHEYVDKYLGQKAVSPVQNMIFDLPLMMGTDFSGDNTGSTTNDVYNFDIDYVRYYKLKKDCTTPLLQSNYNFMQHNNALHKVYNNVRFGQTSCTACSAKVDDPNNTISIRATNDIDLEDGFEVNQEGSFYADNVDCTKLK